MKIFILISSCLVSLVLVNCTCMEDAPNIISDSSIMTTESSSSSMSSINNNEPISLEMRFLRGSNLTSNDVIEFNNSDKEIFFRSLLEAFMDIYGYSNSNVFIYNDEEEEDFLFTGRYGFRVDFDGNADISVDEIFFRLGKGISEDDFVDHVTNVDNVDKMVAVLGTACHEFAHGIICPKIGNSGRLTFSEFVPTLIQGKLLNYHGLIVSKDSLFGNQDLQIGVIKHWITNYNMTQILDFLIDVNNNINRSLYIATTNEWLEAFEHSKLTFPDGVTVSNLVDEFFRLGH